MGSVTRRSFLAGVAGLAVQWSEMSDRPVLVPDKPWEGSCAMPFSGGLWKVGDRYACWYLADFRRVCLAYSQDGLTWEKPDLGVAAGTNIVLEPNGVDSCCIVPDPDGDGFVMSVSTPNGGPVRLFLSPDGVRWEYLATLGEAGDRTTMFFDHINDRWVFNVRAGGGTDGDPRRIDRVSSDSLLPKAWKPEPWLRASFLDGVPPAQLYAFDAVPMGDQLLGLFTIYKGNADDRPKLNEVWAGRSTDGITFSRSSLDPVLRMSETPGAWNRGNVQSVCGAPIKVGDKYRLYASGRAGVPGTGQNGICSMGFGEVSL